MLNRPALAGERPPSAAASSCAHCSLPLLAAVAVCCILIRVMDVLPLSPSPRVACVAYATCLACVFVFVCCVLCAVCGVRCAVRLRDLCRVISSMLASCLSLQPLLGVLALLAALPVVCGVTARSVFINNVYLCIDVDV